MEGAAALEQLRAKLEASFGKALAMMILASASNASGVTTVGLSTSDFLRLSDALCKDQRVVDMWGAAGAADAATEWRRLVT